MTIVSEGQLHLLRPFVEWRMPDGTECRDVDAAAETVRHHAAEGYRYMVTTTSRCPARGDELEGGSIYFCARGRTLFRMPFEGIINRPGGRFDLTVRMKLVRVFPMKVGMVRGWRYLHDDDAPPDLAAGEDLPDGLAEAGLL